MNDDFPPEVFDNHPLPLMDGGQEVQRSGSLNYTPKYFPYILRLSPQSLEDEAVLLYGYNEILIEFLQTNDIDVYVLSQEGPKVHYHLYFEMSIQVDKVKKLVRDFVYPFYPNRTRGFGNKNYNLQICNEPIKAITYILKQSGRQEWSGFKEEFINQLRLCSYEKKSNDFEVEIVKLTQKFLDDPIYSPYQFGADLAIIHSRFDKRVHWRDIQGYVNSKLIKRDNTQAIILANKNLSF